MAESIAVVIVNYNSTRYVLKNLESLYSQGSDIQFSVTVVDNNSTRNNVDEIVKKFPSVQLLKNSDNLGFAGGNNLVLKEVKQEFVLLLNPDLLIRADSIEKMLIALRSNQQVAGVGVQLLKADGKLQKISFNYPTLLGEFLNALNLEKMFLKNARVSSFEIDSVGGVKQVDWLSGSCCLYRMKALREINFFDEGFFLFSEDLDVGYRIHRAGWKLWQLLDVSATHLGSKSSAEDHYKTIISRHHGRYRFLKKHYTTTKLIIYCAQYEITLMAKLIFGLSRWTFAWLSLSLAHENKDRIRLLNDQVSRNRAYWDVLKILLVPNSAEVKLQRAVEQVRK